MPKPTALFDMDGTLADYNLGLYRDLRHMVPYNYLAVIEKHRGNFHRLEELYPWMKASIKVIKKQPNWWLELPKMELGWDIFEAAEEAGFETKILTKGPWSNSVAWKEKVEWVWKHFDGPRDSPPLIIVSGSNVETEAKQGVYGRILVEDYIPYLEPWLAKRPRGLGVLIDSPGNRDWTHPRAVRYDGTNIEEVIERMKEVHK